MLKSLYPNDCNKNAEYAVVILGTTCIKNFVNVFTVYWKKKNIAIYVSFSTTKHLYSEIDFKTILYLTYSGISPTSFIKIKHLRMFTNSLKEMYFSLFFSGLNKFETHTTKNTFIIIIVFTDKLISELLTRLNDGNSPRKQKYLKENICVSPYEFKVHY